MIPDKPIIRINEYGNYYNIVFSAEVIEKISIKFFKENKNRITTSEHEIALDKNFVVESWIISDSEKDKSIALGLEPLPVGTWMLSYKIEDKEYWDKEILSGNKTGFSIECFADLQLINNSRIKPKTITKMKKNKKTIKQILQSVFARIEMTDYSLENGDTLSVDDVTGEAMLNDSTAPDGDYVTNDGTTISVIDGMVDDSESVNDNEEEMKKDVPVVPDAPVDTPSDNSDTGSTDNPVILEDGNYVTKSGITISIVDGNVTDSDDDNEDAEKMTALETELSDLKVKYEELSKSSSTVSLSKTITDVEDVPMKTSKRVVAALRAMRGE